METVAPSLDGFTIDQISSHALGRLRMIAGHLNVPYGFSKSSPDAVTTEMIVNAFHTGSLEVAPEGLARALLTSIFLECDIDTIGRAVTGAGMHLPEIHNLYMATLRAGQLRVPKVERLLREYGFEV